MGHAGPDKIGKEHRKRLDKVRDIQRRAVEGVMHPPDPSSCRFCRHYLSRDEDEGYCMLWKRRVRQDDTCHGFSRVGDDDI